MTIKFKKEVEVTETFEINLPAWYKKDSTHLPYSEYMKVISEKEYLEFIIYNDGDFHFAKRTNDVGDIHKFVSQGIAITEDEFLKAITELNTRLFLAAETQTEELSYKTYKEVTAFQHILT